MRAEASATGAVLAIVTRPATGSSGRSWRSFRRALWGARSARIVVSSTRTDVVRHLIRRCQEILTDLPADDRRSAEEAITTLRRGRAQLDTAIPVRFRGVVRQATPTLFPLTSRENRTIHG